MRTISWGHWGISFLIESNIEDRRVAFLPFPGGACGPIDGTHGSPERAALLAICGAWERTGTLPANVQMTGPDGCLSYN